MSFFNLKNVIKTVFNDLKIKLVNNNGNTDLKLPYINKSNYELPKVNDPTIDKIKEFYRKDYEVFGYKIKN